MRISRIPKKVLRPLHQEWGLRMPGIVGETKKQRLAKAHEVYLRGDKEQEKGNYKSGFRLLLRAAKLGDEGAQISLGYTYDVGLGVRRNRKAAMYWHMKAYRKGHGIAAANIGTIYRDEGNYAKAIQWFQRAARLGDIDANLDVAKIYLDRSNDRDKAIRCLQKVLKGKPPIGVGEDTQEEARQLLRKIKRRTR